MVFAHGGDTNLIHACVRGNTLLPSAANIRIVGANDNCNNNETALDWAKGTNLPPFSCPRCDFSSGGTRFVGKDLTNSYLPGAFFATVNLSGTILVNAELTDAHMDGANLNGANLTNASMNSAGLTTNANLSNANFTNADLTNVELQGATGNRYCECDRCYLV